MTTLCWCHEKGHNTDSVYSAHTMQSKRKVNQTSRDGGTANMQFHLRKKKDRSRAIMNFIQKNTLSASDLITRCDIWLRWTTHETIASAVYKNIRAVFPTVAVISVLCLICIKIKVVLTFKSVLFLHAPAPLMWRQNPSERSNSRAWLHATVRSRCNFLTQIYEISARRVYNCRRGALFHILSLCGLTPAGRGDDVPARLTAGDHVTEVGVALMAQLSSCSLLFTHQFSP